MKSVTFYTDGSQIDELKNFKTGLDRAIAESIQAGHASLSSSEKFKYKVDFQVQIEVEEVSFE